MNFLFDTNNREFAILFLNTTLQLYSWWIETTTLAYVDMDEVLEGNGFVKANVSPLLRKVVRKALHHVPWVGIEGITAYQGIIDSLPHHLFNPSKKDKGLYQGKFLSFFCICDIVIN